MNNSQFRRLIDQSSKPTPNNGSSSSPLRTTSATPLLGSRARSSIPMTPRSVVGPKGNDFARQVAEHKRATLGQQPPTKIFKSSAAPKGTKFAAGYQDRAALLRQQDQNDSQDEKAERIKALEEMVKLQQIDQGTFEKLRDEIGVGGDLSSTHLVKGLDRKLLERVRRGEDVTTTTTEKKAAADEETGEDEGNDKQDVDQELENVLEKEVQAPTREERVKRGEMAPPISSPMTSNVKLSRDEILRRMKASRAAGSNTASEAKPAEPSLGTKFRKVRSTENYPEKKKYVETVNGRRREVLVITNADGTTKRKAKWIDKEDLKQDRHTSSTGEVLGMEIPAEIAARQKAMLEKQKIEEDDDIFEGVGAEYNPLGDVADESDGDTQSEMSAEADASKEPAETRTSQSSDKPRNYFSASMVEQEEIKPTSVPISDPTILAALKRAAAIRKAQEGAEAAAAESGPRGKDFLERLRKREREDAADLDLGFGESRIGDEEDEEGPIWNGGVEGGEKKGARKRGPKKRKGNKDSMKDVMSVLDRKK